MADGVRRTVLKEEKPEPALEAASVIKNFVPRVPRALLVRYLKQCSTEKALHNLVVLVQELEEDSDSDLIPQEEEKDGSQKETNEA